MSHLNDYGFQLSALTYYFNISRSHLAEIPSAMTALTQLIRLDVSNKRLTAAGASLGRCLQLVHLNLSHNSEPRQLDFSLGKASLLTTLQIMGCKVGFPPPEIIKRGVRFVVRFLEVLRVASEGSSLHLRGFFIESWHDNLYFPLGQLEQLRVLSLGHNVLKASAFLDQLASCSFLSSHT